MPCAPTTGVSLGASLIAFEASQRSRRQARAGIASAGDQRGRAARWWASRSWRRSAGEECDAVYSHCVGYPGVGGRSPATRPGLTCKISRVAVQATVHVDRRRARRKDGRLGTTEGGGAVPRFGRLRSLSLPPRSRQRIRAAFARSRRGPGFDLRPRLLPASPGASGSTAWRFWLLLLLVFSPLSC